MAAEAVAEAVEEEVEEVGEEDSVATRDLPRKLLVRFVVNITGTSDGVKTDACSSTQTN